MITLSTSPTSSGPSLLSNPVSFNLSAEYLAHYLPLVSGLFLTAGVLFDWMGYNGFGKVNPYGAED
jgi:hypothetical protein